MAENYLTRYKHTIIPPINFLTEFIPKIVPLGCYVEKKYDNRLLNIKFASFANMYNASDPHATVVKCAHLARDMDYEYFAVQNFGECRTDLNILDNYDTYGVAPPEKCVGGVGATLSNFVYRLRPAADGPNVCATAPCQNGGTCVVHFNDPNRYYCECGDWFTGDNCQGRYIRMSLVKLHHSVYRWSLSK